MEKAKSKRASERYVVSDMHSVAPDEIPQREFFGVLRLSGRKKVNLICITLKADVAVEIKQMYEQRRGHSGRTK